MNKPVIAPVSKELLKAELKPERLVRLARKGGNEIYIINYHNAPNVMREIGRLREISFRDAGGGTGEELDIDEMDTSLHCYEQLIVWDAQAEEIIGGYRFIYCSDVPMENGEPALSTAHYFSFTEKFIVKYLPKTIELGRSWVQPEYQPANNPRKGLYALDNIWDGLGALCSIYPEAAYFFGKVTMYPSYDKESRNFILYFLNHYFPDDENLMISKFPLEETGNEKEYSSLLKDLDYKDGYRVLKNFVRARGENIPPLISIYMGLSSTMKTFGTAINPDFGGVEETGILITIDDIHEQMKKRYIHG